MKPTTLFSFLLAVVCVGTAVLADEPACNLPLSNGTTHALSGPALARCNRYVERHVCRRFCKDTTLAADICTVCKQAFAGPCGVHPSTTVECCGSGIPACFFDVADGLRHNVCPPVTGSCQ